MTKHAEDLAKLGWQYFECPACGSEGARAFSKPEQEPVAYVKTVIEALYENSDPVSVEAAELLEHISTPPQRTWVGISAKHHVHAVENAMAIGAAAEREACAKVCDDWTRTPETTGMELTLCAAAIRARGQEIELGISYEEANPPEPYCKRCGKKLGTEAHDVHTCTPKFDGCDCDSPAWCNQYKKCHRTMLGFEPYVAPSKKEWVGLTDEEIREGNKDSWVTRQAWESAVWWAEAKLKEKNT